jgi:hypothetical protein
MTNTKLTRPQEFWRDHVLPNCKEYRKHPDSIRHAMNAALSAFHMADWVWTTYHDTDPQKVAGKLCTLDYSLHLANNGFPDFLVLKDIAEAHKHLELDRPTPYDRAVTSAGATGLRHIGAITRLGPMGTPMAAPKRLVVQQQDGSKRAFDEVIENVIRMWKELIEREGL